MDPNELTIISLILAFIFGIPGVISAYYAINDHSEKNQGFTSKEEHIFDKISKVKKVLLELRDKWKSSPINMLIFTVLILLTSILLLIVSTLSFLGVHRASDLIPIIYGIINIYKNFNVDLKILIFSIINIGFTFYVLKLCVTPSEILAIINIFVPQKEEIKALSLQINELKKQSDDLFKIQTKIQQELDKGEYKEAMRDLQSKKMHTVSKLLNEASSEIFRILKKYEVKGHPEAYYIYNPYLQIIIECTDNSGIVKIPGEVIKEIKNLEHKFDIKIEFAENKMSN
ncbi:hypothetical protein RG963_14675 [Methanosarcina sp. Z-7115]|uniref:Uncharacterized protein n=1 Tax=Methanosarcina baikalica TaxID=3073890 RepID=A0ABU2D573_9EURY|nr:hypothetical protein [Methanosarcina sp. Z-7115]MDR7667002.1 hypothetical protein [Methanosarcina sp. Z-7115]